MLFFLCVDLLESEDNNRKVSAELIINTNKKRKTNMQKKILQTLLFSCLFGMVTEKAFGMDPEGEDINEHKTSGWYQGYNNAGESQFDPKDPEPENSDDN
jgi:hypothetical protein